MKNIEKGDVNLMRILKLIGILSVVVTTLCFSAEKYENAIEFINQGKYKEAVSILEKLSTEKPDSIEIKFMLGVAYVHLQEYILAESCFNDVLSKSPDYLLAHYYLAMIYEQRKMDIQAINEWNKVVFLTKDKKLLELAKKHIKQLEIIKR
jgi:tetratricopeptide (TPR) repeat protein